MQCTGMLLIIYASIASINGMDGNKQKGTVEKVLIEEKLPYGNDADIGSLTVKEKVISYGGMTLGAFSIVGLTFLGSYFPVYYIDNTTISLLAGIASGTAGGLTGTGFTLGFYYWFKSCINNRRNQITFVIEGTQKV